MISTVLTVFIGFIKSLDFQSHIGYTIFWIHWVLMATLTSDHRLCCSKQSNNYCHEVISHYKHEAAAGALRLINF